MRTITIPPLRVRPAATSPIALPWVPKPEPRHLRCVQVPNPLANLSDDAIAGLVDHLEDDETAVIVDAPLAER